MKYVCTYQRAGGWYGSWGIMVKDAPAIHFLEALGGSAALCHRPGRNTNKRSCVGRRDERGSAECGRATLENEQQSEFVAGDNEEFVEVSVDSKYQDCNVRCSSCLRSNSSCCIRGSFCTKPSIVTSLW